MAENSNIEWTDHTFNPWIGCSKVSPGCAHCYAETLMANRYGRVVWGDKGTRVRTADANWRKPLAWDRAAAEAGRPALVFTCSLADFFEDRLELFAWRREAFDLMEQCRNLIWLVLTKRVDRVIETMKIDARGGLRWFEDNPHVAIGTSIEDRKRERLRLPRLVQIPCELKFLSVEPLLGRVDLTGFLQDIDWCIVGGESGPNARPMHPDWVRLLRDQCIAADVPFFFKQWGEWAPTGDGGQIVIATDGTVYQPGDIAFPDGPRWGEACRKGHDRDHLTVMRRVGKKAAGRLLDGQEWSQFPEAFQRREIELAAGKQ